jgi:hypothetical protein
MEYAKKLNPQLDIDAFMSALNKSLGSLDSIDNLQYHGFYLNPDAPPESPESFQSFEKLLREGPSNGDRWDGQLIASGLRLMPPLLPLFERVVNSTITNTSGKTKILFSGNAQDHWGVVQRGFPGLGLGEKP